MCSLNRKIRKGVKKILFFSKKNRKTDENNYIYDYDYESNKCDQNEDSESNQYDQDCDCNSNQCSNKCDDNSDCKYNCECDCDYNNDCGCDCHPNYCCGVTGATGEIGPTGPTGATGATGTSGITEYAYIYNVDAQVVAIEADISFSANGIIVGTITHAPGTSTIQIGSAGDYAVWFHVNGVQPNQFALFQNGAPVTGAVYGSGAGTQGNDGMVIITAAAGDVLTLRNHSSSAGVTL